MFVVKLSGTQNELPVRFDTALIHIKILKFHKTNNHEILNGNILLHIKTAPKGVFRFEEYIFYLSSPISKPHYLV
jgi:hypothetical protein